MRLPVDNFRPVIRVNRLGVRFCRRFCRRRLRLLRQREPRNLAQLGRGLGPAREVLHELGHGKRGAVVLNQLPERLLGRLVVGDAPRRHDGLGHVVGGQRALLLGPLGEDDGVGAEYGPLADEQYVAGVEGAQQRVERDANGDEEPVPLVAYDAVVGVPARRLPVGADEHLDL